MNENQSKIAMMQTRRAELTRRMRSAGCDWADGEYCRKEIRLIDKALKYLQA